ncbi:MAG: sugar ABC transporter substrate-binding protein [Treponema sp.]|jgi:ABC-type sugar transport system substrate-binding protein|nr:sugar ABC transporter substrate-binding protein [Treponema sp.]
MQKQTKWSWTFALALIFFMAGTAVWAKGQSAAASKKVYIGFSMVAMDNEAWATMARGAQAFVDSLPAGSAELVIMTGREAPVQWDNIQNFVAKYGSDGVLWVDPITIGITPNIAALCEENDVYYVNLFNKEASIVPTDYTKWVVFMTQDDEANGYLAAKTLFDSIGGRGNVLELYGVQGNDASFKRNLGLKRALSEYPNIKLLDTQIGNFDGTTALTVTENWLTRFQAEGTAIDAIFAAGDTMALGAIEALKQKGLAGRVKVCGIDGIAAALDAVKEGTLVSTIYYDGYLTGGYGVSYAYAAKTGRLNPQTMDQAKRMFYTKTILVTKDNVDSMITNYVQNRPKYDYANLDAAVDSIIPNPKLK